MSDITKSSVLSALKKADIPNFNKDLLILNSIKNVDVKDDKIIVSFSLGLQQSEITEDVKKKFSDSLINEFPSVKQAEVNIQAKVTPHMDQKKDTLLPGVKNTIAVASGKGGVGKSTVAVNLAVALAKEGYSVGLIDADIYGPSIPLMLGINEKPKIYQNKQTMKMIPLENYGIKFISIGLLVDDNAPVIWRGPMASGAVKQFMSDVEWGEA